MTASLEDWIDEPDDEIARRPGATDEILYLSLDIRARELALKMAIKANIYTEPPSATESIVFTAQAFYDFLTGESDAPADSTEQPQ